MSSRDGEEGRRRRRGEGVHGVGNGRARVSEGGREGEGGSGKVKERVEEGARREEERR